MRRYLNSLLAVGAALLLVIVLLMLTSDDPLGALGSFVFGPFSRTYHFGNMLAIASILIICGAGMTLSFQAGLFNLGGEGQIYAAGTIGTLAGLLLPAAAGTAGMIVIVVTAMIVGALAAGLSGFLKARYNIHELISSFLLSSALVLFMDYLIAGPLRDTSGFLQSTQKIPESFHLESILPPSNLTAALGIALLTALLLALWLYRTPGGYELRVFGSNPSFADFGRIPRRKYTILPMMINGACFGLAGALMVMSTQHAAIVGFSAGYGWNGIAIALIARSNPLMTIPAALLMAWIEAGVRSAMSGSSLSFQLTTLIRGIILLLITLQFIRYRRGRS